MTHCSISRCSRSSCCASLGSVCMATQGLGDEGNKRLGPCPLWVKSGHPNESEQCPLYPQQGTSDSGNKGLVLTPSSNPGKWGGTRGESAIPAARRISGCRLALERVGLQYHSLRQVYSATCSLITRMCRVSQFRRCTNSTSSLALASSIRS